jgi:hypothetical protein
LWYELILTDRKKGHCFGVQKKEASRDEVPARRCKTCLELASLVLVDQDVHFQTQVVSMSLGLKLLKKGAKTVLTSCSSMCGDKQGIELYPATSAIEKTRASPLPSTSHIMPMLFGKTNAKSNCDEQPAVMRLRVSTQHLHSLDANSWVQQGRLEKKTRVYCGQCVSSAF